MKFEECSPRHPRFEGCRSFKVDVFENGELTEISERNTLSGALYQAGRVLEIARTDKRDVHIEVWDRSGDACLMAWAAGWIK